MQYNSDVLRNHAKGLYVQAAIEILVLTGLGLLIGYGAMSVMTPKRIENKVVVQPVPYGTVPSAALNRDTYHDQDDSMKYAPVGVGGIIGLLLGVARANSLRVKAQSILCQVAIEENTSHRIPANY